MAIRRFLLSTAVTFSLASIAVPYISRAEDAPGTGDVETAKHKFVGVISGNGVFVRSSPREDAYPTMKLEKGQKVTVVGIKFKWLKILPPEGSFAYVPKAYVNLRGDGKIGRASRDTTAKVGSTLNQIKTAPMAKIDDGTDMEILGEQDDYYKIKPPEGTYLYVNESFVEPVEALPNTDVKVPDAPPVKPVPAPIPDAPIAQNNPKKTVTDAPTTQPNESSPTIAKNEGPSVSPDGTPATQPADATAFANASELFTKLEADFKVANEKPITDQPIDSLLAGYNDLMKLNTLSARMKQISTVRVSTLELRAKAKAEYLTMRDTQVLAADRQKSLVAEHDEIQQRIKEKQVLFYVAVGTLRASSIQRGNGILYRLTDPASGRTVAYVRTDDPNYAGMLGQFVGVKGTLTTDPGLNMKMIEQATPAEAVDPAKVNDTVSAQIIPPSLMGKAPTARVSD